MRKAMGGEGSILTDCPPGCLARTLFGQVYGALFPSTKAFGFYVSPEWIAEQKQLHAKSVQVRKQKQKLKEEEEGEVACPLPNYVSTNDCVVSAFLNCLQPDVVFMAANFRGKVPGFDGSDDVGNYEELITYLKGDYETPQLIRLSVLPPIYQRYGPTFAVAAQSDSSDTAKCAEAQERQRLVSPMLTNWQHLSAQYAAVTNWSTFAKPLVLPSSPTGDGEPGHVDQELHLPLFDWPKACPACIFGSMVLFRPTRGRIAAIVAGKKSMMDKVKRTGMVDETTPLGIAMEGGGFTYTG
jgi:hypothetical protein